MAGRKRKGDALRVPICFSVDPAIRDMARELRAAGFPLNIVIASTVVKAHAEKFKKSG